MLRAYDATERRIQKKQAALVARIAEAERRNEPITATWLGEQERYRALIEQLQAAKDELAATATPRLMDAQTGAVLSGAATAEKLAYLAAGGESVAKSAGIVFNRLPKNTLLAIVGATADGSPLSELFVKLAGDRAGDVRDTLIAGIGSGAVARKIERELQTVASISRARAATIARTELHRAQRTASVDSYQASGVVEGWYWNCACDVHSCPVCWAMHGTWHSLSEPFGSHPSCRCYVSPALKDFRKSPEEKDVRPKPVSGSERFARLTEDKQRQVLGQTRFELWKGGEAKLADFVHTENDPKWGIVRRVALLRLQTTAKVAVSGRESGIIPVPQMMSSSSARSLTDPASPTRVIISRRQNEVLRETTSAEKEAFRLRSVSEVSAIEPIISRITRLPSRWKGEIEIHDGGDKGTKPFRCNMQLSTSIVGSDARWRTLIHEDLHAHSAGLSNESFVSNRGFEEGVVEQLQRLLRDQIIAELPEYLRAGYDKEEYDLLDRGHTYNIYIAAYERVRKAMGDEPEDFYLDLLRQPVEKRNLHMILRASGKQGNPIPKARLAKSLEAVGKASAVLKRDLNLEAVTKGDDIKTELAEATQFLFP